MLAAIAAILQLKQLLRGEAKGGVKICIIL